MSKKEFCITVKHKGRSNMLYTPIAISRPSNGIVNQPATQLNCLWDTGASATVITQGIVNTLGLAPTGKTLANTASATGVPTNTYQIDVYLNNNLVFRNITVMLGVIVPGLDCLLGMDIIGQGDLSITNLNGNTCLSFRSPSMHEIDFYNNPTYISAATTPIVSQSPLPAKKIIPSAPKTGRNDPCTCGKNTPPKKYKNCCGKAIV